ncbi:protein containing Oligopeptide/dipeptide ABC transporter, partial [mine drainage metagenome]
PGSVPNLISPPSGCRFHPRCAYAMEICKTSRPPMTDEGNMHHVACFLYHGAPVTE